MTEYLMPAEWEPHEATWLAWPHNASHWDGAVGEMEELYAAFASEIVRGEKVYVLVPDAPAEERARGAVRRKGADLSKVVFHRIPAQDVWIRDYGPIAVKKAGEPGGVIFTKWRFNAWGGKYADLEKDDEVAEKLAGAVNAPCVKPGIVLEGGSIDVDGSGTCLVTEQCLLNPNRNPGLSRNEIEGYLSRYLGARKTVWLAGGIAGDDTDGHVDDAARFVAQGTVLAACEDNPADANYAVLRENLARLEKARDSEGRPFRIVRCPMPPALFHEKRRLAASYANFYVSNGAVFVPVFGRNGEDKVLGLFGSLFPGRRAVGISSSVLVRGCGSLHCVTQQLPVVK